MIGKLPEIGDIWRYSYKDKEFYFLIGNFSNLENGKFARLIVLGTGPGWNTVALEYLNRSPNWSYMA